MKKTSSFLAQVMIGIIFSLIGLPFLIIGIYFAFHMVWLSDHGSGDVRLLPVIFCLLGGIFVLIGGCFLVWVWRKKQKIREVIEGGNSVNAIVSQIVMDSGVEINGQNPYRVICQYQDPQGTLHIFRSGDIMFNPGDLTGKYVRVYVEAGNLDHYYVDIDSILPEVKVH